MPSLTIEREQAHELSGVEEQVQSPLDIMVQRVMARPYKDIFGKYVNILENEGEAEDAQNMRDFLTELDRALEDAAMIVTYRKMAREGLLQEDFDYPENIYGVSSVGLEQKGLIEERINLTRKETPLKLLGKHRRIAIKNGDYKKAYEILDLTCDLFDSYVNAVNAVAREELAQEQSSGSGE